MKPARVDFVVVGAGAAGCVLAARLSENPQHRVLLLEAGGADSSPLIHAPGAMFVMLRRGLYSWASQTEPQTHLDGRVLFDVRGKVLGGSTWINGMRYCRGSPRDWHVELLQATGDGLWSPQNVGGIHHVGMWSADPVADSNALLNAGGVWEASMHLAPGMIGVVFVRHRGILIEFVTDQLRKPLLDWIERPQASRHVSH